MVRALAQHQVGAGAGRQHVLLEVGAVDLGPDGTSLLDRLRLAERCVAVEVGVRVGERPALQAQEALDVPLLDVGRAGIDVDGEVEKVAHGDAGAGCRLQHVDAFDDEHLRPFHDDLGIRHDVVDQVRVHRSAHLGGAALHLGNEAGQRPAVVALGEPLALQQPAPLELLVRPEETVGGDQFDVRGVWPSGQQLAQQPRDRRLADRDRSGDADHERGRLRVLMQEGRRRLARRPRTGDVQVEQPAERQVDLRHLGQVERITQAEQALDVGVVEREWQARCEGGPIVSVDLEERCEAAVHGAGVGHPATLAGRRRRSRAA